MRLSILCGAALFLCASAAAGADAAKYEDLVALAQKGDAQIDYTALRVAYTQSDDYDPYDFGSQGSYHDLLKAMHDKDCPAVLEKSQEVLKRNYLSIFTHLFRAECFEGAGDMTGRDHELAVANGLKASLEASGDGKTADTAFVVVTMSEEHYLLVGLGFPEEQQALINSHGHMLDQISGHDEKTGEMRTAYFDVGALLAGMQHKLDKGHASP